MSRWTVSRLGEIATWYSGGTPSKSVQEYWGGDIPWISGASLKTGRLSDSDRRVTPKAIGNGTRLAATGSTLILVRGMSLLQAIRIGRAMRPLAFNQDVKALAPNRELVDEEFLTYALMAKSSELLQMVHRAGHGTGVLDTDQLKALEILLPSLDVQRRIASVLGSLDDLIETNRTLSAQLGQLWRTVLDREGAESHAPLSALAQFVNGKNFTKNATGAGRPVIRTPEVREGPDRNTTIFSTEDTVDAHIARRGDILFVWSGSLCVNRWQWADGLVNQHVFKVVPAEGVPPWLVMRCIERAMTGFLGIAADKATTMGHIKRTDLNVEVLTPQRSMWGTLASVITPLWEAEMDYLLECQTLSATRDELLPLLMSGQVVPEAVA